MRSLRGPRVACLFLPASPSPRSLHLFLSQNNTISTLRRPFSPCRCSFSSAWGRVGTKSRKRVRRGVGTRGGKIMRDEKIGKIQKGRLRTRPKRMKKRWDRRGYRSVGTGATRRRARHFLHVPNLSLPSAADADGSSSHSSIGARCC
jgi:hypothetical protein